MQLRRQCQTCYANMLNLRLLPKQNTARPSYKDAKIEHIPRSESTHLEKVSKICRILAKIDFVVLPNIKFRYYLVLTYFP